MQTLPWVGVLTTAHGRAGNVADAIWEYVDFVRDAAAGATSARFEVAV